MSEQNNTPQNKRNTNPNNTNQGNKQKRKPNNRSKNYRGNNKNRNTQNNKPTQKITHKSYVPKKKKVTTFIELNYTDKVILSIGFVTVLISIGMWFMGHREEAAYLGLWVPGIFSAGTFIRIAFTRASRR